jgi:hypothetical protein
MKKTVENGVIRLNEVSFLEFSRELSGFEVANKQSGRTIPKFILFWKGLSIAEVKNRYNLVKRTVHNDDY